MKYSSLQYEEKQVMRGKEHEWGKIEKLSHLKMFKNLDGNLGQEGAYKGRGREAGEKTER